MDLVDRRTGKLVNVPDSDVQKAFQSGLFGLPKGAQLPVVQPGLGVGTVDAAGASQTLSNGARVATDAELHRATMENRYGGMGGAVGAGVAGAVRGAGEAFGLPADSFASDLADLTSGDIVHGGDSIRERLRAYKELHPYASLGGELTGLTAATLASGGENLIGGAGRIAEHLAPEALGRVGTGLARGAAEGSVLGGVGAVNESALGDTDLTASKLVAGMGEGALFGGALGAGFSGLGVLKDQARGAAGRYLARLAPKDIEAIAEKTFGYTPEGLGEKVARSFAKVSAAVSGKDPEAIERFLLDPEARRTGVFDAPKIQEETERVVRQHVDDLLRSGDLVSAEARGSLKADYVSRSVAKGNEVDTRAFTRNQLTQLIDGVESQLTHADGVAPQMVKPLETLSRSAYQALDGLDGAANPKLFVDLDNVKRVSQKLTSTGYRSIMNIADPLEQLQARRSVEWMRSAADDLRDGLQREDLWGKAAADQRVINAAWTKQIDASQRFHRALTTDTVRDPNNPYVRLRGADPGKVGTYVRNLTNPNNDLTHAAVRDFVSSTDELASAISKSYDLPADKVAEVARVREAANGFGKAIGRAEKSLVTANQYEALTKNTSDSPASMLGTIGSVVGGIPGGMVGSLIGGASSALANPGRTIARLAAVERFVTKVDSRMGSSLRSFFRGGASARPTLHEVATPDGFNKTVKLLSEAVDVDGNVTPVGEARIQQALGDLSDSAPKLATAASGTMMRVMTFLAMKLPTAMRDPRDMFPGENPPLVSDTEREAFARTFEAATDPPSVFEHLAHGSVTPEEAEALKVCHPPLYAEAGQEVERMAIEAAAKGKPLEYTKRVELGVLFEKRTDATLGTDVMSAVAQARAAAPSGQKRGGGGGGGGFLRPVKNLAPRFMTTFEASASRRKAGI